MYGDIKQQLQKEIEDIKEAGLYKQERIITSPQAAEIQANGKEVLNFCANNYLGLSSHKDVIKAIRAAAQQIMRLIFFIKQSKMNFLNVFYLKIRAFR